MPLNSLLVVDIETVPDEDQFKGKGFPSAPFHHVVAIAFLEAEIQRSDQSETYTLKEVRCGGDADYTERQLLEGFFQKFERARPRLVTYNGRSFDLPVIKYRAMRHGVSAPWLHKGGDRYGNYSYRYNIDWHCDLLDALSDFGASKAVKLDEVAKLFGFPGKFGIDGSKIKGMYKEGRISEIRDYCETDVFNTYLVYLRYMLHRGDLTKEAYNTAISDVIAYIDAEIAQRPHLVEFKQAWAEACGHQFQLS